MFVEEEVWKAIPGYDRYQISNYGRVYNVKRDWIMATSQTPAGHMKIALVSGENGPRHTLSVAQLVAEAFVEPPNVICDHVMILDGNLTNVAAYNLVWRPRWFVWRYANQFKRSIPLRYQNLIIRNLRTEIEYQSILDAARIEGLLMNDIWRSTYTGGELFPYGDVFEIIEK